MIETLGKVAGRESIPGWNRGRQYCIAGGRNE